MGSADNILTWRKANYECKDYVCILDLKSGVRPQDDAPDNYQLAAYASLQYARRPFCSCVVAIISPDAFGPKVTMAIYTDDSIDKVVMEIFRIREATLDPRAQPVAGEKQCLYCRAKTICPAYREKFMAVEIAQQQAISTLPNKQLLKVWQAIRFAKKIDGEVSDELIARIENGSIPGKLRSTGSTRVVTDPHGLWERLLDVYGEREGFAAMYDACRKLSFGDFEKLIQELEGGTQKRAKEIAAELTDPFVTKTPKSPTPVPE